MNNADSAISTFGVRAKGLQPLAMLQAVVEAAQGRFYRAREDALNQIHVPRGMLTEISDWH